MAFMLLSLISKAQTPSLDSVVSSGTVWFEPDSAEQTLFWKEYNKIDTVNVVDSVKPNFVVGIRYDGILVAFACNYLIISYTEARPRNTFYIHGESSRWNYKYQVIGVTSDVLYNVESIHSYETPDKGYSILDVRMNVKPKFKSKLRNKTF